MYIRKRRIPKGNKRKACQVSIEDHNLSESSLGDVTPTGALTRLRSTGQGTPLYSLRKLKN